MANRIASLLFPLVATGLFEVFFYHDWEAGPLRALTVVGLLGWLALARNFGKRFPPTSWPTALTLVATVGIGFLIQWHIKEGVLSIHHQRHSEMGDIHARAAVLLSHHTTPWHFGTVLDSGTFNGSIRSPEVERCRQGAQAPTAAQIEAMWDSAESGQALFPSGIESADCLSAKKQLALSGYKYGPVMLALYLPLVMPWGRGGVYATHLVFLALIIFASTLMLRQTLPQGLLMALGVLLGQSVLRRNTLLDSDCDLLPTAMLLGALLAFERHRPLLAGGLAALTVAMKIFPGAFLVPLVVAGGSRSRRGFVGVSLLAWAPAWAIDGVGVWDNVVRFNLHRPTDSTALAHFAPRWLLAFIALCAIIAATWAFFRWVVSKANYAPTLFVTIVMGLFFVSTKVFHNNYLVWWLPLMAIELARALRAPRKDSVPPHAH